MTRIAAFWQWHSLFTTYVGPDEAFSKGGEGEERGKVGKKAFSTTAFCSEMVRGPVKEFVSFLVK